MTSLTLLSRRSLLASIGGTLVSGTTSAYAAPSASAHLNVRDVGAAGDGIRDDTDAFVRAFARARSISVPAGTYLVERVMIPADAIVATAGFATRFKQRAGLPPGTRLLNVVGSNVRLGDCTVEGNIRSDTGEQYHGVFVQASPATGDLSNIGIGNVHGVNLRGDVVYIGSREGRVARNIAVGHVHGDNVIRNVVSICGGRNLAVAVITGTRVGMTHLDLEPEDDYGPVIGFRVGTVRGAYVQIAGSSPLSFLDDIRLGLVDLSPPIQRSDPLYLNDKSRRDALVVRNYRSLDIERLVARGFAGAALRQIWNRGELTDQRLHIAQAELSDCCKDFRASRAYVVGSTCATRLKIDDFQLQIGQPGVDGITDCREVSVARFQGKLPGRSRLVSRSNGAIHCLVQPGDAPVFLGARPLAVDSWERD